MIVTAIILVGSVNALSYNVVHYLMIQMTSAVTTTVLGEVKIVGLLVLSVLLLGKSCLLPVCLSSKFCLCILPAVHSGLACLQCVFCWHVYLGVISAVTATV